MPLTLRRFDGTLAIAKLPLSAKITLPQEGFFCALRTGEELSVVCATALVPKEALSVNDGWAGFYVQGPLDFSLTGILAGLSGILARAGIPLFVLSTFDTDWILVKEELAEKAAEHWRMAGHSVVCR